MRLLPLILAAPLLLGGAAPGAGGSAAQLGIAPLTIRMGDRQSAIVRLTNHGTSAIALQLRPFAWSQPDGSDRLSPGTNLLLVSPAIARIAPGKDQVFRLFHRGEGTPSELAYRLLIDELPDPQGDGGRPAGPRLRMQFSLPVFAGPPGDHAPRLAATAQGGEVRIVNSGSGHIRIGEPLLRLADGRVIALGMRGPVYLLAGGQRSGQSGLDCIAPGTILQSADGQLGEGIAVTPSCP